MHIKCLLNKAANKSSSLGEVAVFYFILHFLLIGAKIAVKAMQKVRISDYDAFKNEIAILKQLVS